MPLAQERGLVVDLDHPQHGIVFERQGADDVSSEVGLKLDHAWIEDVQGLALGGEGDASGERGNAVHRGPELIADVQVQVGVDALCPERIQKRSQARDGHRVERRVGGCREQAAGIRWRAVGLAIHVVQAHQVHAELAEAPGDARGIGLGREIRAEGQVDAEQADGIAGDGIEMPVPHGEAVDRGEGMIQEAEIRRTTQTVLVQGEGEEPGLGRGRGR